MQRSGSVNRSVVQRNKGPVAGTKLVKTLKSARNQIRNVDFLRFFDVKFYVKKYAYVISDANYQCGQIVLHEGRCRYFSKVG
ncbi:hypothetical protein [Lysinibacillus sp. NPDC056232]|uniref:hypothetical protein n=1 Tax=Lysinibacillus sp. NPDC056232 TaxID=3345756 RepID=UPI0035D8D869